MAGAAGRRSKYAAVRCECRQGGALHQHDSLAERDRCLVLHAQQERGEISGLLVHQPTYQLRVNGQNISRYTPDFTYCEGVGLGAPLVVEDFKARPTRTRAYVLRKKLMRALYQIEIREVTG